MNFINPFPLTEHEVFRYTFLQGVDLDVRYIQKDSLEVYWERFKRVTEDEFNIEIPSKPLPGNSAVTSKEIETRFVFNYDASSAFILIGHKGYNSFEHTMLKRVDTLLKFLSGVAEVDTVKTILFRKRNIFPFNYEGELNVNDIFKYVFSSKYVGEKDIIDSRKNGAVKFAMEKKLSLSETSDADLLFTVGYSVKDDSKIDLLLDLSTDYRPAGGIPVLDFRENLSKLNGIIYDAFMSLVTDNVIKVMREGLKK